MKSKLLTIVVPAHQKYFEMIHQANELLENRLIATGCMKKTIKFYSAELFGSDIELTYEVK